MKITPLVALLLAIHLPYPATAQTNAENEVEIAPLLKTHWGQGGLYALYTPKNAGLGCWSVALAQILYYHRVQPSGVVTYQGEDYLIKETLDQHQFDWALFADKLAPTTPSNICSEVARYCYFTAVAIGKNFPTGYKGNSDYRRAGVKKHYQCASQAYSRAGVEGIRKAIVSELSEGRPLLLYIGGQSGLGHALVIDGVRSKGTTFQTHFNFGWYGGGDGWFDFEKPIKTRNGLFDAPFRCVYAIRPSANKASQAIGADAPLPGR